MALPVFRAAGAKSNGTTGAVTVAAPAGVATGDLEILVAGTIETATISITNNGGSAWTPMTGSPVATSGAGEKLYVWWRIRQGGDGDPEVTPSADHSISARLAYQAGTFDTSDPFEIEATGTEETADTSFSWAPGTSTTGADRLVLVISTTGTDSNTGNIPVCTNAALSALASRANYCTNSGGGGGFGITEGAKAAAGAIGTFACTYTPSVSRKAYMSFAIKPVGAANLFGAIAVALTAVKDVVGRLTAKSSSTLTETVAVVTAGFRTRFGAAVVAETVALSTAGTVSKSGAATLTESVAVTTAGQLGAKAAIALTLTVADATVGTLTAKGSSTLGETVTVGTVATRETFSVAAVAESVTVATAGALGAKGATSLLETVSTSTIGSRETFAASSVAETVAITTAGDVSTGATTHFGVASLTLTDLVTTTGRLDAHAIVTATLAVTGTSVGIATAFGAISQTETVTVTTAGAVAAGVVFGVASLGLTVRVRTGPILVYPVGRAGAIAYPHTGRLIRGHQGRFARMQLGHIDDPLTGQIAHAEEGVLV